ncbi:hypothetical protein JCM10296v2_000268 [Rhodotorula toruloides]
MIRPISPASLLPHSHTVLLDEANRDHDFPLARRNALCSDYPEDVELGVSGLLEHLRDDGAGQVEGGEGGRADEEGKKHPAAKEEGHLTRSAKGLSVVGSALEAKAPRRTSTPTPLPRPSRNHKSTPHRRRKPCAPTYAYASPLQQVDFAFGEQRVTGYADSHGGTDLASGEGDVPARPADPASHAQRTVERRLEEDRRIALIKEACAGRQPARMIGGRRWGPPRKELMKTRGSVVDEGVEGGVGVRELSACAREVAAPSSCVDKKSQDEFADVEHTEDEEDEAKEAHVGIDTLSFAESACHDARPCQTQCGAGTPVEEVSSWTKEPADEPVDEAPIDCSNDCWIRGGALTAADGNCGIDAVRIAMGEPTGIDVSYLRAAMVNVFRHVYRTLENYAPPEMRERGYVTVQTRGHGVECVYSMDELVEWKGQDGSWLDGPDFAVLLTVIGRPVILFSVSQVDYGFPSRTRFFPAPIYTANESTQATIAQVRSLLHSDPHQHPIPIFYDGRSRFVASIDELHGPHAEGLRKNTHLLVDDPLQPIFPVQAKLAVPRSNAGGSPPSATSLSSSTPPFKPVTIPAFGPDPAVTIPRTDCPSTDRQLQEPTSIPAHPDLKTASSSSLRRWQTREYSPEDWVSERDETDENDDSEMFYDDDSRTASTANFFAPAPPTPTSGSRVDSGGIAARRLCRTTNPPPNFNFDESLDVELLLEEGKVKEWLDVGFAAKSECASVRTAEEASERRLDGPFFLVGGGEASRFEVALPSDASGGVRDALKPAVLKQQAGGDPTTGVMAADDIEHLNADGDRGIICVFATSFDRLVRAGSSKLHFIIQADQAGKLVPALIAGNRLHHENLRRLVEKRTADSAVPPPPLGVPATYDTSSFFSWTIVNLPSNKTALFHTKRKVLTRLSLRAVEIEEGSANPSNNGSGLAALFQTHKHAHGSMSAETAMRIAIPASTPLAAEVIALTERLISHRYNNGLVLPVSPVEWRGLTKEGLGDLRDAAQAVVNSTPRQMTPVQARTYDLPLTSEVVYGEPVGQRLRRRGKDGGSRVSEKLAALDLQAGQIYLVMCSACLEFRVFRCKRTLSTIPHPGGKGPRDADEVKRVVDELRSAYKAVAVPIQYDGKLIGSTSALVDCWYNQLTEDLVGNEAIHNSFAQFVKANPKHPDHPYGVICIEKRLPGMLLAASRGAIVLARQHNAVHIWSTRFSPVSEDDPADEVVDADVRLLLLEGALMPQDQKTRQGRARPKPNALVPVMHKQVDSTQRADYRSDYRARRPATEPTKPVRPASAYLTYQNENRASVKADNPDLPPSEINKRVGEMWKALPPKELEARKSRMRVELEKWRQEMRLWESAQAAKEDQQGALPAIPSGDTNAKRACETDDEVAPDAAPKPAKTRKVVHERATLSLSLNLLSTASYDELSKGTTQKSLSEFRVAQEWSKTVNAFRLKDGTLVHGKEALLRNTMALAQQKQDETSPALPSNSPVPPNAPSTQPKMRMEGRNGDYAGEGMEV